MSSTNLYTTIPFFLHYTPPPNKIATTDIIKTRAPIVKGDAPDSQKYRNSVFAGGFKTHLLPLGHPPHMGTPEKILHPQHV